MRPLRRRARRRGPPLRRGSPRRAPRRPSVRALRPNLRLAGKRLSHGDDIRPGRKRRKSHLVSGARRKILSNNHSLFSVPSVFLRASVVAFPRSARSPAGTASTCGHQAPLQLGVRARGILGRLEVSPPQRELLVARARLVGQVGERVLARRRLEAAASPRESQAASHVDEREVLRAEAPREVRQQCRRYVRVGLERGAEKPVASRRKPRQPREPVDLPPHPPRGSQRRRGDRGCRGRTGRRVRRNPAARRCGTAAAPGPLRSSTPHDRVEELCRERPELDARRLAPLRSMSPPACVARGERHEAAKVPASAKSSPSAAKAFATASGEHVSDRPGGRERRGPRGSRRSSRSRGPSPRIQAPRGFGHSCETELQLGAAAACTVAVARGARARVFSSEGSYSAGREACRSLSWSGGGGDDEPKA